MAQIILKVRTGGKISGKGKLSMCDIMFHLSCLVYSQLPVENTSCLCDPCYNYSFVVTVVCNIALIKGLNLIAGFHPF